MGKITDSSILAGSKGRTGRIVVKNRKGFEFSSIRPTRHKPDTSENQLLIRNRWRDASKFMESYKEYACHYFGKWIGLKSPYNMATVNILESIHIDTTEKIVTRDFHQIAFSKGSLAGLYLKSVEKLSAQEIEVSWFDNSSGIPERQADKLQILVALEDSYESTFIPDVANREELKCKVQIPFNYQNKVIHLYGAFKSEPDKIASNSIYLGKFEPS